MRNKPILAVLFFIGLVSFPLLGYYSGEVKDFIYAPRTHLALLYGSFFILYVAYLISDRRRQNEANSNFDLNNDISQLQDSNFALREKIRELEKELKKFK